MKKIYETAYEYIEEIVKNIAPVDPDKDDLIQDVALVVLEKPPEFISELYDKNQLKYYIARVIMNNLFLFFIVLLQSFIWIVVYLCCMAIIAHN